MKAFVSAMLVAALLLPMLLFISLRSESLAQEELLLSRAFAAEASRNMGETALLAVKETMRSTASEKMPHDVRSIRETQVEIARRLAEFEEFAERSFEEQGIEVDLWCGSLGEAEGFELVQKMAGEGNAAKCENCWDMSRKIVLVGKGSVEEVGACAFAVLVVPEVTGGSVGIGNAGLSLMYGEKGEALVPLDEGVLKAMAEGEIAIGVSIYDRKTGAASVRYLVQGDFVEY